MAVTEIDENDPFSPLHAPGRLDTAVQHFFDKLLHIQQRLKTEPGKAMGAKRHKFVGVMYAIRILFNKFERWSIFWTLCKTSTMRKHLNSRDRTARRCIF